MNCAAAGHMRVQHYPGCLGDDVVRDGRRAYEHCDCIQFTPVAIVDGPPREAQ